MDALRNKGVSKIERRQQDRLVLLIFFSGLTVSALVGALAGLVFCIPAVLTQMTFSAAWSLYGFKVAIVVSFLALLVSLMIVLFAPILDSMLEGTGPKNDNYR